MLPPAAVNQQLLSDLFARAVESHVDNVLASRDERKRRERRVTKEEGATEIGISPLHLMRLMRRHQIKGYREEGTRRFFFALGELLDWRDANLREDGGLKGTLRRSAPPHKEKEGK
jgi:hypothetical protein